jgi:periplasmic divalent cation tolerance protein
MKNEITILYTPCPDKKSAKKIGQHLIKEKLAACVQMHKVNSIFPWNGKIESANEVVLFVKTLNKKFPKAKSVIKKNHPYEVPCILHFSTGVNREYYNWMKEVLN